MRENANHTELKNAVETFNRIALYAGSFYDLSTIDLAFLNLRFGKIDSKEFQEFIGNNSHEDFKEEQIKFYLDFIKTESFGAYLYALYPIDINSEVNEAIFWDVQECLLVASPSDFRIFSIILYQYYGGKHYENMGHVIYEVDMYLDQYTSNGPFFLSLPDDGIIPTNEFIRAYFERKKHLKYLDIIVSSYISSFFQTNIPMGYLSLCISLEALIEGATELNYRIRRACSIINGNNINESKRIFDNVKHIYDLRSKIVHGENYKWESVQKYYPKLRALVSRTIIELITFNIESKKDLNDRLTELGFGGKLSISPEYRKFEIDINTMVQILLPLKDR